VLKAKPTARCSWRHDVVKAGEVRQNIGFCGQHRDYGRACAWEWSSISPSLGAAGERLKSRMEQVFTTLRMNDYRDVLGGEDEYGHAAKRSLSPARLFHDSADSDLR